MKERRPFRESIIDPETGLTTVRTLDGVPISPVIEMVGRTRVGKKRLIQMAGQGKFEAVLLGGVLFANFGEVDSAVNDPNNRSGRPRKSNPKP